MPDRLMKPKCSWIILENVNLKLSTTMGKVSIEMYGWKNLL